jgi:hypothetical protein
MLQRPFRIHALSLAGGAVLLGGATLAAGAMTLPGSLPGGVTHQATAAVVTDGDAPAKVEQVWWRGRGWGWHRGWGWGAAPAGAGGAAGGATGTLMLAAVGNAARRSSRARNAS